MHALRRNILAIQAPAVGGVAQAYPVRRLQQPNRATQPPLPNRAGPGALTNLPHAVRSGSC